MAVLKSPLNEFHLSHGAKFETYGEWEMPASYLSYAEEYETMREHVGVIDHSCLTKIKIKGEEAVNWLDILCTGNIFSMAPGKSINTAICKEDGQIVALVLLLQDDDAYWILTDPDRRLPLIEWLNSRDKQGITIEDHSETMACISVIGPRAVEIPQVLIGEDILGLPYLGFEHDRMDDIEMILYRCGFSGEYEYRFLMPANSAGQVWEKILACGQEYNIKICGLKILDILMMEMKSINQQKDFKQDVNLLQLGLHWMVQFCKDAFVGKEFLESVKAKGLDSKLITLVFEGADEVKAHSPISVMGKKVGEVVHSGLSLTLNKQIGLGYIDAEYAWVGVEFEVLTEKGQSIKATTVSAPLFITKTVKGVKE